MRDDLEWEAAEQEGLERLYEELAPQAVNEFTAQRLKSYYIANIALALPAFDTLLLAQRLQAQFPRAAVVFAATAIEVTLKDVLLKPVIYGLVHNDLLAELIANLSVKHTGGLDPFKRLLSGIFQQYGVTDLTTFKRNGSTLTIVQEMKDIQEARNRIVHSGAKDFDHLAQLAIDVASTLLSDLFPRLLLKLGLHAHASLLICTELHCTLSNSEHG